MINCVIIDDEPLAREGMASYVKEVDFLHLVATCENPVELIRLLDAHPVDLIFLDIQTPVMNGIDFLKIARKPPMVIITTAFPSYALESFQLDVLDYLLKPITFDRFFKAANKVREYHQLITRSVTAGPQRAGETLNTPTGQPVAQHQLTPPRPHDDGYFFIKCGNKYEKIHFDDILYIQGRQNYVTICTDKGNYLTLLYLKNLEENLDESSFIRVHKSFIVSIGKIQSIDGNEVIMQSYRIPISRNYREQVIERVVNNKLWAK